MGGCHKAIITRGISHYCHNLYPSTTIILQPCRGFQQLSGHGLPSGLNEVLGVGVSSDDQMESTMWKIDVD